jgi:hypothetical protein
MESDDYAGHKKNEKGQPRLLENMGTKHIFAGLFFKI